MLCLLLSLTDLGDIFLGKKDGRHFFVYVLEYMLTLVSLDKMQNISILICKSSKSEGRAF